MATKSFTTDFKFNRKNAVKLMNAIENSKAVKVDIRQRRQNVTDKDEINKLFESFHGDGK